MGYEVVYNVAEKGYLAGPWWLPVIVVVAPVIAYLTNKDRDGYRKIFVMFWIIIWTVLGGIAVTSVFYQRWQSINWLKNGNYQVVEGKIENFDPMPYEGHKDESFTIKGIKFSYSDYDLSTGAFNQTRSHGGPISEGKWMRICYKDGRILKIEKQK